MGTITVQRNLNAINAKDYGAVGGGNATSATDTTALTAALAAAAGRTLFIPDGTYTLTSDLVPASNTTIMGEGRGTVLRAGPTTSVNCLKLTGVSHVTISDLQIDGNKANVNQLATQYTQLQGIYITGASDDITITRCYIHDCYVSGIMADSSTNLIIANNRLLNCGDNQIYVRAKSVSPYTICSGVTITGNISSGSAFSGIQVLGSSYVAITGNVCFSNGPSAAQGNGIGSEGGSYVTIAGNVCFNNGIQGIQSRFTGETGGSQSSTHIVIADNVCYGHSSTNGDAGGIGINDTDDILCINNLVYGNAYGINLNGGNGNGVQHCKLMGNTVRGNTNLGIRVIPGAGSTAAILENNYVADNANDNLIVNGVQVYVKGGTYAGATGTHSGIHLQTGADKSLIDGAMIYDNTDNGIVIDSPVANVDIRNCWFHNITGQNQNRALQEQAGAGPTMMVNCRIQNQKTNRYVFNNASSRYWDEQTVSTVTVTTNYTMLAQDEVVLCNQAGAITVTLPAATGGVNGKLITVKDKSGNASTNNVTVSGAQNIDGAGSKVINTNYGVLRLVSDGANWFTL